MCGGFKYKCVDVCQMGKKSGMQKSPYVRLANQAGDIAPLL